MKKVVVVGAGTMGAGIAQVVAQAGYDVVLGDINEEFVQRGFGIINKSLSKHNSGLIESIVVPARIVVCIR